MRSSRPDIEGQPGDARTILVPEEPSPALAVRAPVVWRIRQPVDLKTARAGELPPHPGREFLRNERLLADVPIDGALAAAATVTVGLVDRRGRRAVDLLFTRTPEGARLDLPLQSLARGEYLIAIDAQADGTRATAYVPIRIADR